jgi:hypothetical protein
MGGLELAITIIILGPKNAPTLSGSTLLTQSKPGPHGNVHDYHILLAQKFTVKYCQMISN